MATETRGGVKLPLPVEEGHPTGQARGSPHVKVNKKNQAKPKGRGDNNKGHNIPKRETGPSNETVLIVNGHECLIA